MLQKNRLQFLFSMKENLAVLLPIEKAEGLEFPGRWLGGSTMILGPLLLLIGVVLRLPFSFFFPAQLAAFENYPTLMFVSYSAFAAGNVLLWPAIFLLARRIGTTRPGWALFGGAFVIFGLFARTFHAGADHLAFQLVHVQNLELATKAVADSYGTYHIFHAASPAIILGWVVLAIGAYSSRTMGWFRSVALGLTATLPLGILKGTTPFSVVATLGLCVALIPQGVQILCAGPRPQVRVIIRWLLFLIGLAITFFLIGEAG
ncbi:hypothetical protein [Ktedonospora formicarum]|uniref:Uncharacterized protein n=1 Tax=Ktedonospora formicarum TaxID=2778364 RepID=A0A8J3IA70_9CHLR|nr:hypothetical protein [Ktedonospora formicarum]GHO48334.1 hypothetical protein KSX_64970 [Ktedonospora formicarum]